MTKLNTIATTCLAVSGFAMAQVSPAPTTAPAAPRTGLYSSVTRGNIAADNTVDDYSRRPTLIGDRQYLAGYGGGELANAAFSIKGKGMNWFGAVTGPVRAVAGSPDSLRLGLADGTAWGAGLILATHRTYAKNAAGETTTYFDGSGLGLFGDFNLGSSDVYGSIGWSTGFPVGAGAHNSSLFDPAAAGSNVEINHHQLSIMGGWKKDATAEGTHSFNIEATYVMAMHTDDTPPAPDVDDNANILAIMPMWGYILRMNSDYSVFVGVNSRETYQSTDVGGVTSGMYSLELTPNICFQKQLGHGFEGFSGFSVSGSYSATTIDNASNDESSDLLTGGADMTVGLRWVKDNLAFEGSLSEALLSSGPNFVGGGTPGLFGQIGLSLGF
jgi:hypothetical protein